MLRFWFLVTVLSRLLSISYYALLFWELTAFSVNKRLYGMQRNSSELEFMGVIFHSSSPYQTSFLGGWLECYKITVTLFFPVFEINFQVMFLCFKWQMRTRTMLTTSSLKASKAKTTQIEQLNRVVILLWNMVFW